MIDCLVQGIIPLMQHIFYGSKGHHRQTVYDVRLIMDDERNGARETMQHEKKGMGAQLVSPGSLL